jgi:23S rRNA C2498 (ribose-2'-O)-methylase RlmM
MLGLFLNQQKALLFQTRKCCCLCFVQLRDKSGTSSNIWLDRQRKDPYVKRAVKETYRARSAFKLIEINEKINFLNYGDIVIDIGACPGSWSQVAVKKTNSDGIGNIKIYIHFNHTVILSLILSSINSKTLLRSGSNVPRSS